MGFLQPKEPLPPPAPPPPPSPPTMATPAVGNAGAATIQQAAAAQGGGLNSTITNIGGAAGLNAPTVAGKTLLGQ